MGVTLRSPFPAHAWPLAWQWIQPYRDRVWDDSAPTTCEAFVDARLFADAEVRSWAVLRGEDLGGLVWFEPAGIAGELHLVLAPGCWGHAVALAALELVAGEIFERAGKIEMLTFPDNAAVIALLRRAGFRREGRLRAHALRGGVPVDVQPWGLLKGEFECRCHSSV